MSYINEKWNIKPQMAPQIIKHCSKCGRDTSFNNSYKFRVNANGKSLDIWMIFNCEECKTSYNLSLYERINPSYFTKEKLEAFTCNDRNQIEAICFDFKVYQRNKVKVKCDNIEYINTKKECICNNSEVELLMDNELPIRVDKFLCRELGLSRNEFKEHIANNGIVLEANVKANKSNIRNGMKIKIKKELYDFE